MAFSVYYSWCLRPIETLPQPIWWAEAIPELMAKPGDDDSAMIQRVIDSGSPIILFLPRVYELSKPLEFTRVRTSGQTIRGLRWTTTLPSRFRTAPPPSEP
jgi:hypothetical protein